MFPGTNVHENSVTDVSILRS